MIVLTRFDGTRLVLNDSHIERIDITPDTVITLMNGDRYLVRESAEEIISLISDYQAKISSQATRLNELIGQIATSDADRKSANESHNGLGTNGNSEKTKGSDQ